MLKNRLSFFTIFLLLVSFGFVSCLGLGLGDSIDTEGPELTITSPSPNSYVPLEFTLEGECSDNVGVTSVIIADFKTNKRYGNAIITGNKWTYTIKFNEEDEGEKSFLVTATDAAHQSSVHSTKVINLLVDATAPIHNSTYIKPLYEDKSNPGTYIQNSAQTSLLPLESLKNINFAETQNRNIPQNEAFEIHSDFTDAMSIQTINYKIYDGAKLLVEKSFDDDTAHEEGVNIFTPHFTVTQLDLIAKNDSTHDYSIGRHYLKLIAEAYDKKGNYKEYELGYMLWYPESDKPGVYCSKEEEGEISILIENDLPIEFYDDDKLSKYAMALITPERYDSVKTKSFSSESDVISTFSAIDGKKEKFTAPESNSSNQVSTQIKVPSDPQQMYFFYWVKDSGGNTNYGFISTQVRDRSKPMIFFESPKSNEQPTFDDDGIFRITGYILGKRPAKSIRALYVAQDNPIFPLSNEQVRQIFETNDISDTRIILSNGCYSLDEKEVTEEGLIKNKFTVTFPQIEKLKEIVHVKDDQYFYAFEVTDEANTKVYSILQLNKDTSLPEIEITTPREDLSGVDYKNSPLVLEFTARKETGLKITDYKINCNINGKNLSWEIDVSKTPIVKNITSDELTANSTINLNGNSITLTVPSETLKKWYNNGNGTIQPEFKIEVTDILEISAHSQRIFCLTELPYITTITTENFETYKKIGDKIYFNVNFSDLVEASDDVKLAFKFNDKDSSPHYASFDSNQGNTVKFAYVIQEGDSSEEIKIVNEQGTSSPLTGGSIKNAAGTGNAILTNPGSEKIFENGSQKLRVDGISPKITGFTISSTSTKTHTTDGKEITYCKAGTEFKVTLAIDDTVTFNDYPDLILKSGTGKALNFKYSSSKSNKTGNTIIDYTYTVTTLDGDGLLNTNKSQLFTDDALNCIQDNHGNSLKNTLSSSPSTYSILTAPLTAPAITAPTARPSSNPYNSVQTLVVATNGEYTTWWSKDGGVTYEVYDYNNPPTLSHGDWEILTKSEDFAGNFSEPQSQPLNISIRTAFVTPSGFNIVQADGIISEIKTNALQFTLTFDDTVNVAKDSATITFTDKNGNNEKTARCNASTTNTVNFYFTTTKDLQMEGIAIKSISFTENFKDRYNHKATDVSTLNDDVMALWTNRDEVKIDTKAPSITDITYDEEIIDEISYAKITLTFDEHVNKESGTIILQRQSGWAIPAVLTDVQFKEIYDSLDGMKDSSGNKYQDYLLWKDSVTGGELTHSKTGMPLGPYLKTTHGLRGDYDPDEGTKYVLAYDLGLYSGNYTVAKANIMNADSNGNANKNVSVAQIRSAFEKAGYHQHKVEVDSSDVTVTNNADGTSTVEIIFTDKEIEKGRNWELIIPSTAFVDLATHNYKGMDGTTGKDVKFTCSSSGIETPVVRVDRYSHGWGAREPSKTGTFSDSYTNGIAKHYGKFEAYDTTKIKDTAAAITPTGYVRARMDCETKGVTLNYKVINKGYATKDSSGNALAATDADKDKYVNVVGTAFVSATKSITTSDNHIQGTQSTIPKLASGDVEAKTSFTGTGSKPGTSGEGTTQEIIIGDGSFLTARRDYILCQAVKDTEKSEIGMEGAFKTVIRVQSNSNYVVNIEGGTAAGGRPNVSAFPLRDGTTKGDSNTQRYSKNCYCNGSDGKDCYWVSYEIISTDMAILVCRANHSQNYGKNSYGQFCNITYCYDWDKEY